MFLICFHFSIGSELSTSTWCSWKPALLTALGERRHSRVDIKLDPIDLAVPSVFLRTRERAALLSRWSPSPCSCDNDMSHTIILIKGSLSLPSPLTPLSLSFSLTLSLSLSLSLCISVIISLSCHSHIHDTPP